MAKNPEKQSIEEKTAGKPQKPMKMTANQIAIAALSEQGLNQEEIAKTINVTPGYVSQIKNRSKEKYSLCNNIMIKSAHKAVKNLLAGEPFGSIKEVKDSTSLQAAKMVYDRFEPIQSDAPVVSGNSFTEININVLSSETIPLPPVIIIPQNE